MLPPWVLMCPLLAGGDAGTPLAGLGSQHSPPALPARAEEEEEENEEAGDSASSLPHLPFGTSAVPPAPGCSLDLAPRSAHPSGSQQQPRACRRRRHKF